MENAPHLHFFFLRTFKSFASHWNRHQTTVPSCPKEPAEVVQVSGPGWHLEVFPAIRGDPRVDPELTEGITYLIWPGHTSGSLWRNGKKLPGRGAYGITCIACCHLNKTAVQQMKMDWNLSANHQFYLNSMRKWCSTINQKTTDLQLVIGGGQN